MLSSDEAFKLLDAKALAPEAAVRSLVERGIDQRLEHAGVEAAREGRREGELATLALPADSTDGL